MRRQGLVLSGDAVCLRHLKETFMSVTTVYQTTCRFCHLAEAALFTSLNFIADVFVVAQAAARASNMAQSGEYAKAKETILDI